MKLEPLESITIQSNEIVPCKEGDDCSNSPSNSITPRCRDCRLTPNNKLGILTRHFWKPINSIKIHPILEQEKRDAKREKALAKAAANKAKDSTKQARLRESARAERKTNAEIIRATRNSGRINRDGDHLYNGDVLLDTKNQSTTEHPVVRLNELDKVRRQAANNNKLCGALVIRNKSGRGVIVIDERDISKFIF